MKKFVLPLVLGIKRLRFRDNDSRRTRADAEFKAKRKGVHVRHKNTCAACEYVARTAGHLDVHHRDDNHHNNEDENLVLACHTCHPYQHVGELVRRVDVPGEGLGKVTRIACIPELDAVDLNLLQRALGAALLDEKEAPVARLVVEHLVERASWVRAEFGTYKPADFAGAMAQLTDEQYPARDEVIGDLRLLFNEETLKRIGRELVDDYPALPVSGWASVADGARKGSRAEAVRETSR